MINISIVVPVYNSETTLSQCVESLLTQTVSSVEIILVDDGSKDRSGKICDEYAQKDSRIKVFHKMNEGVSAARNDGIMLAAGETVMFVDSDDCIRRDMCEVMWNLRRKNGSDLCICGFEHHYYKAGRIVKREISVPNPAEFRISENHLNSRCFTDLYTRYFIFSPWNKLYSTEIIKKSALSFSRRFSVGEDLMFNLSYLRHCSTVSVINEPLYFYRREENESLSQKFFPQRHECTAAIYEESVRFCREYSIYDELIEDISKKYLKGCFCNFETLFSSGCSLSREEKKQFITMVLHSRLTDNCLQVKHAKDREMKVYQLILGTGNREVIRLFTLLRRYVKIFLRWRF